ncbi:MAG: hypothetical protein AB1490_25465 [Pseudomonadota bacterium]
MATFRIPKQTDASYLTALQAIRQDVAGFSAPHQIQVRLLDAPWGSEAVWSETPDQNKPIQDVLDHHSSIMPVFWLRGPGNQSALTINRKPEAVTDEVHVAYDSNWFSHLGIPEPQRNALAAKLIASTRKYLRSVDAEATFRGSTDTEWDRFRNAQSAVLNSLQETQRSILSDFTRKSLEMEADSKARLEAREAELQTHYNVLKEQLAKQQAAEAERVATREQAIENREKSFNTKEARYVARSEQQKQIEQITGWLNDWSLTKTTRSKRYVIIWAYAIGAAVTGGLTFWFSKESMAVIAAAADKLHWWQWLLLSIKSIFPLAAFITIVAAFIRWSSDWAKQHADEEFRNRARILDIGRTAWLLEAVRDAQDNNKELPPDLVKELSRNLFAYSQSADSSDLHPQAVSDLLLQGLNSLRVKGPDGSEIEAKRGK